MATRTLHTVPVGSWLDLGAGIMTVQVKSKPDNRTGDQRLFISNTEDTATAQVIVPETAGTKYAWNNEAADNVFVQATSTGWTVVRDA